MKSLQCILCFLSGHATRFTVLFFVGIEYINTLMFGTNIKIAEAVASDAVMFLINAFHASKLENKLKNRFHIAMIRRTVR